MEDDVMKELSNDFKSMKMTNAEIMDGVDIGSYEGKDFDEIYKRQIDNLKSIGNLVWLDIPDSNAFIHATQAFMGYGDYGCAFVDKLLNGSEEDKNKLKLMFISLMDYISDGLVPEEDNKTEEPEILQK